MAMITATERPTLRDGAGQFVSWTIATTSDYQRFQRTYASIITALDGRMPFQTVQCKVDDAIGTACGLYVMYCLLEKALTAPPGSPWRAFLWHSSTAASIRLTRAYFVGSRCFGEFGTGVVIDARGYLMVLMRSENECPRRSSMQLTNSIA
jgi:hypothetical protein